MAVTIKLRRGPAAEWTSDNPVLNSGEPGVETDTGRFKIGNGSSAWTDLDYIITEPQVQALIEAALEDIEPGGTNMQFWNGTSYEAASGTIYLGGSTDPTEDVGDIWIQDDGTVSFYTPPPPDTNPVLTVVRATSGNFQPRVSLAGGSSAVVQWYNDDTDVLLATGLTPSIALASGTHHIRMAASVQSDVTVLNLGYLNTQDAGELNDPTFNHASQYVTAISDLNVLTGLERFFCANTIGGGYTGNLAGALDFTDMADLIQIECFDSLVSSVNLTGCASLRRLCLEACNLSGSLNINPVRLTLQDIRAAVQKTGSLTFTAMASSFPALWHFCVRDQPVTNPVPLNLAPVMRQYWAWNCGLTTAAVPNSTDADSFLLYENNFNQSSVDNILVGLQTNALANDGIVQLTDSAVPSSTGIAAAAALESGGWTVEIEEAAGPVLLWEDTFNRANATGYVAVGNSWAVDGGNCNIVSNTLRRTGSGYCVTYNPAGGSLPADLRLEMDVVLSSGQGTSFDYFGIAVKYDPTSGDGIKVLLNPWNVTSADALNVGTSADPFSSETVTLDTTVPRSGWASVGTHTLALEVQGSTARVYFDGTLVGHATYTPTSPGVNIGIVGDPGTANAVIDAIRVYSVV